MSEQTKISNFAARRLTFFRILIYLVTGAAYLFTLINFVLGRPLKVIIYNLIFAIIFTFILFIRTRVSKLSLFIISAFAFQAFIFGHAYFILPGKQLEMGIGVMTCILPVFFEKRWLWFFFVVNFILFHISLSSYDINSTFLFQYVFFIVVFIFINSLVQENKKYEEMMVIQQKKIAEDAQSLKEMDEVKNRFFANVSHELRTPLTLLLAPMDKIINSNELSNKHYTYLQMMQQNGKKLLKRINELLDLARLDADTLKVKEVSVFCIYF